MNRKAALVFVTENNPEAVAYVLRMLQQKADRVDELEKRCSDRRVDLDDLIERIGCLFVKLSSQRNLAFAESKHYLSDGTKEYLRGKDTAYNDAAERVQEIIDAPRRWEGKT